MCMERLVRSAAFGALQVPAAAVSEVGDKPRLRGVLHQYVFFASLGGGMLLVVLAATTRATVAAAIYGASVSALLGSAPCTTAVSGLARPGAACAGWTTR
jgi:hypothetical protein